MAISKASQSSTGTISVGRTTLAQPYIGVTPLVTGSGNVANAPAVATLTGTATTCVYLCGFAVTGSGVSGGSIVVVTVAGLLGGMRNFVYAFETGVTKGNPPLIMRFDPPLPAADLNTPIVVTCPAGGSGNTNNMVFAHGYSSTLPDTL